MASGGEAHEGVESGRPAMPTEIWGTAARAVGLLPLRFTKSAQ